MAIEFANVADEAVTVADFPKSRLTIILHPNESRIDIALSDRKFSDGSRWDLSQTLSDETTALLNACKSVIGIERAEVSRNELSLELGDGVLLREFLPPIVAAVRAWGGEGYDPAIYLENRRYAVAPRESDDGYYSGGVKQRSHGLDVGFPYTVWKAGS